MQIFHINQTAHITSNRKVKSTELLLRRKSINFHRILCFVLIRNIFFLDCKKIKSIIINSQHIAAGRQPSHKIKNLFCFHSRNFNFNFSTLKNLNGATRRWRAKCEVSFAETKIKSTTRSSSQFLRSLAKPVGLCRGEANVVVSSKWTLNHLRSYLIRVCSSSCNVILIFIFCKVINENHKNGSKTTRNQIFLSHSNEPKLSDCCESIVRS